MCNKNGYSLKEVRTVLNEVKRNKNKKYRRESRYYLCPLCSTYHLTSQEEYFEKEIIPFDELLYKE